MQALTRLSSNDTHAVKLHRKIKIGFFSAYPPDRGRLSEYAEMLVKNLVKRYPNVLVTVYTDHPSARGDGNVRMVYAWRFNNLFSLLKSIPRIVRDRNRILIFNVHFAVFGRSRLVNFVGFLTIFLYKLLGIIFKYKTIVILHNVPEAIKIETVGLRWSLINKIGFLIAEKLILFSDVVVVLMRSYVRMLKHRFNANVVFIPHGAWTWNLSKPVRSGRNAIVFIGYLSPTKDLGVLVEAFKRLRRKFSFLELVIAGSPHPNFPETAYMLDSIGDIEGVRVYGYVPDENIPRILRRALAVVLPYKTATGTSGVLHLVSGAAIPVVAPRLKEFRELLLEGAGIVSCNLSPSGLEDVLTRLIIDEEYWLKLALRSLKFAEERSWERVADEFYKLFIVLS